MVKGGTRMFQRAARNGEKRLNLGFHRLTYGAVLSNITLSISGFRSKNSEVGSDQVNAWSRLAPGTTILKLPHWLSVATECCSVRFSPVITRIRDTYSHLLNDFSVVLCPFHSFSACEHPGHWDCRRGWCWKKFGHPQRFLPASSRR